MNKKIISDFQKMIDVNTPIIYIHAYDFVRVDDIIGKVVGASRLIEWNPITRRTNFSTKEPQGEELLPLDAFLRDIYLDEFFTNDRYIILRDIQDIIDTTEVKTVLQLMALRLFQRS